MLNTTENKPLGREALERAIAVKRLTPLAEALGVRYQVVQGWRDKSRRIAVPVEYCLGIEKATNGAVTRMELRPSDWWTIWPDLAKKHAALIPSADKAAA